VFNKLVNNYLVIFSTQVTIKLSLVDWVTVINQFR
jgi:hypothetical protein